MSLVQWVWLAASLIAVVALIIHEGRPSPRPSAPHSALIPLYPTSPREELVGSTVATATVRLLVSSLVDPPLLRAQTAGTRLDLGGLRRELYNLLQLGNQLAILQRFGMPKAMSLFQSVVDHSTLALSAAGLWPVEQSVDLSRDYMDAKEAYVTAMEASDDKLLGPARLCAARLCAPGSAPPGLEDELQGLLTAQIAATAGLLADLA